MECPTALKILKELNEAEQGGMIFNYSGYPRKKEEVKKALAELEQAINNHEKLTKHVEALKSVCEKYIPTDKIDEANNEVILLSVGIAEEIGRKLLAKQAHKEAEKQ